MRNLEKKIESKLKNRFIIEQMKKGKFDPKEIPESFYNIEQNTESFHIWMDSMMSQDSRTIFFYEIFNCFQMLPEDQDYCSYSQSYTTFCLSLLEKMGMVEIYLIRKYSETLDLIAYKKSINPNYQNESYVAKMYEIYFRKIKSFQKDDIRTILKWIQTFHINNQNIEIKILKDIPILKWKKEEVIKKITTPSNYNKIIKYILEKLNNDLLDDTICEIKQTKRTRKKKEF